MPFIKSSLPSATYNFQSDAPYILTFDTAKQKKKKTKDEETKEKKAEEKETKKRKRMIR